jgi:hypothetical protein
MILPGETEAGSAGMQPCRGIAWRAHRDDDRKRGNQLPALRLPVIGSKDPDALKIPARRAEFTLTENASSPFHVEPEQLGLVTQEMRKKKPTRYIWGSSTFSMTWRVPVTDLQTEDLFCPRELYPQELDS